MLPCVHRFSILLLGLLLLSLLPTAAQDTDVAVPIAPTTAPRTAPEEYIRSSRLGITFINSAQLVQAPEPRYENALLLGAGWTRWPLYWNEVQTAEGEWDWSRYDELVAQDIANGLQINVVLIGRPAFYAEEDSIVGLREPVFADGSNRLGDTKTINPANPWANFVYEAVERYKPGGVLAQQRGWERGQGVRLWEMWNEPDHEPFWSAGIREYAQLLKVGYLAAHQADPQTMVMIGGLLYSTQENWLSRVLSVYAQDPLRDENNWYMDAVAVHSYSYPWRTGWLTLVARQTLIAWEIDRPIFVNETGLSVWNDYPGPEWTSRPDQRMKLGTMEQQAWYFIQSTAYAWGEGADVVFFHQLYDDCGDEPAGTDFPPNDGALCSEGQRCFGNAFGVFRNTTEALCYTQHPEPGTARPIARAYHLMAQVFGTHAFERDRIERGDGYTQISFTRPATSERIVVIWNRTFEPLTVQLDATSGRAQLYSLEETRLIDAADDLFTLQLAPAKPDSYPNLEAGDPSAVGGSPVIIVERLNSGFVTSPQIDTPNFRNIDDSANTDAAPAASSGDGTTPDSELAPTQRTLIQPTPGSVLQQLEGTSSSDDTTPPVTSMTPLPPTSAETFQVQWSAQDNNGIALYMVWVRENGGEWSPWLETQRTEAAFTGDAGKTYEFAVWAQDVAGNWSANTNLRPQATTRTQ